MRGPLGATENRFDKELCGFVVLIFDILENEKHLTIRQIVRLTRLSQSTVRNVKRLAEIGRLTNRRQVRTVQRLAEIAGIKPFPAR